MDHRERKLLNYINKFVIKNFRVLFAIFVSVIIFRVTRYLHFEGNPLLNSVYLGESLVAASSFVIIYFLGHTILAYLISLLHKNFISTLTSILTEFGNQQTSRIVYALKKETVEKPLIEAIKLPEESVVLDTSAIIDGRILGVIKTGFLDNSIIVTQNVIDELQHMADKSDDLKRAKGRMGLDVLKKIRKEAGKHKFSIVNLKSKPDEVDKSLVELCKKTSAKIATVDFNLNKTAQIAGVTVLNVNLLANEVKSNLIPGDTLVIKLIQKGKEKNQAVGYLEDGTMIVVQNAENFIGEEKSVLIERVLQTEAGRLIFGSLIEK